MISIQTEILENYNKMSANQRRLCILYGSTELYKKNSAQELQLKNIHVDFESGHYHGTRQQIQRRYFLTGLLDSGVVSISSRNASLKREDFRIIVRFCCCCCRWVFISKRNDCRRRAFARLPVRVLASSRITYFPFCFRDNNRHTDTTAGGQSFRSRTRISLSTGVQDNNNESGRQRFRTNGPGKRETVPAYLAVCPSSARFTGYHDGGCGGARLVKEKKK